VTVRIPWDILTLDPAHQANEGDLMGAIYSRLITYAPDRESWGWRLEAAESLEEIEPTRLRFKLREGIMFTGGYGELTAEDVKYSFERHALPEVASAYATDWVALDKVEIIDRYTGDIVLKQPYTPIYMTTLPWVAGMILSKAALEKTKNVFENEAVPPAMSGPYHLVEWKPKEKIVLKANPDYPGPKPAFAEVILRPIDDDKTAEIGFDAGEIAFTNVAMSSVPRLKSEPKAGVTLNAPVTYGIDYIGVNTAHPALSDVRVRRALQLGTDFDAIIEGAYFGVAERATGLIPRGMLGYRESLLYPKRDVEKAQALLAEAGAEGLSVELTIIGNSDFQSIAQIMQASLSEIGVDLQIKVVDSGAYWSLGSESAGEQWKDLQLYLTRFFLLPDPIWFTTWFTPEQIGIWNWERWDNKEYGELNAAQGMESDPAKRAAMIVKMQDLMEESGAYLWITNGIWPTLWRDPLKPAITPDGRYMLLKDFA
jgi:peptide/nickel transport system substrate-binding protein